MSWKGEIVHLTLKIALIILTFSPAITDSRSSSYLFVNSSNANNKIRRIEEGKAGSLSDSWLPDEFPNPQRTPSACGRYHSSYVCDPGKILSPEDGENLDTALKRVCNATPCACARGCSVTCPGYVISVAILPTVSIDDNYVPSEEELNQNFQTWADYLRMRAWNFGHCDNTIVLVLSVMSKQVWTSVGTFGQERMTPECIDAVTHDAQSLLQAGRHAPALLQMIRDYRTVLLGKFKCVLNHERVMTTGKLVAITLGSVLAPLMLGIILIFVGPCCRGPGFGGSGAKHKSACKKYRYHQPVFDVQDQFISQM